MYHENILTEEIKFRILFNRIILFVKNIWNYKNEKFEVFRIFSMHHFPFPNFKIRALYNPNPSNLSSKTKKKKEKKEKKKIFVQVFLPGWKKGKSILWKLIETDRILEGLRGLEGINFSFFSSSSSFFLQLFSSNFFWQVEKEGEREEIPFNQKVASEDKVVLYRQREKCIAKLLSSQTLYCFSSQVRSRKNNFDRILISGNNESFDNFEDYIRRIRKMYLITSIIHPSPLRKTSE